MDKNSIDDIKLTGRQVARAMERVEEAIINAIDVLEFTLKKHQADLSKMKTHGAPETKVVQPTNGEKANGKS